MRPVTDYWMTTLVLVSALGPGLARVPVLGETGGWCATVWRVPALALCRE